MLFYFEIRSFTPFISYFRTQENSRVINMEEVAISISI